MKESMLSMVKKEMHETVEAIDYSNLSSTKSRLKGLIALLNATNGLAVQERNKLSISNTETYDIEITEPSQGISASSSQLIVTQAEEEKSTDVEDSKEEELPHYEFSRKLRGGMLKGVDAFVPESKVRELSLKDGDLVTASLIEKSSESHPDKYDYELYKPHEGDELSTNIGEIDMALVTYKSTTNDYVVSESFSGGSRAPIALDDVEFEDDIKLYEKDIEVMNIVEGDIVDIAFYKNNPENARIRWRHSTMNTEVPTPKKPSFYKNKDSESDTAEELEQVLEGKTVLLVGGHAQWSSFRDEVEALGGTFAGIEGGEPKDTVINAVSNADYVIMNIVQVSHKATITAVEAAKKFEKPYGNVNNMGRKTFINAVKKLIPNQ